MKKKEEETETYGSYVNIAKNLDKQNRGVARNLFFWGGGYKILGGIKFNTHVQ